MVQEHKKWEKLSLQRDASFFLGNMNAGMFTVRLYTEIVTKILPRLHRNHIRYGPREADIILRSRLTLAILENNARNFSGFSMEALIDCASY